MRSPTPTAPKFKIYMQPCTRIRKPHKPLLVSFSLPSNVLPPDAHICTAACSHP